MSAPSNVKARRRVGLFGGAFDPVHDAHVALAHAALTQLDLQEVRWIPTGQPWYKNSPMVPALHRIAMVAIAIDGEPRFNIDVRETERVGHTYTLDTVIELQAEDAAAGHEPPEWYLILGQDQLAKFHTWHGWKALVSRVTLAVAARSGQAPVRGAELDDAPITLLELDLPQMEISSTDVRACLAQGRTLAGLVPDAVAGYIARHGLYSSS